MTSYQAGGCHCSLAFGLAARMRWSRRKALYKRFSARNCPAAVHMRSNRTARATACTQGLQCIEIRLCAYFQQRQVADCKHLPKIAMRADIPRKCALGSNNATSRVLVLDLGQGRAA